MQGAAIEGAGTTSLRCLSFTPVALQSGTIVPELWGVNGLTMLSVPKPIGADKTREANTLAKAIGAEITELRKSRGWSQAEVAHLTGYTEKWIRSTEMGANTTVELLAAVAFLFSIKLSELIIAAEQKVEQNRKLQS